MNTKDNHVGKTQNNSTGENNFTQNGTNFLGNVSCKRPRGIPINEVLKKDPSLRDKRLFGLQQYFERKKAMRNNPEGILLKEFKKEYGTLPDSPSEKVRRRYLMLRQVWLRLQQMKREEKSADIMARQEIRLFRFLEAYAVTKDKFLKSSDDDQLKKVREIVEDYGKYPEKAKLIRGYIETIMQDPTYHIPTELEHLFLNVERGDLRDAKIFDRSENAEAKKEEMLI